MHLKTKLALSVILVKRYEGTTLLIPKVTPKDLGAYLCIATNGVSPARSKRVFVYVQCKICKSHKHGFEGNLLICVRT